MSIWIRIVKMAVDRGIWISTAESCTGGSISSEITNVPGSSGCFIGGLVAYSNKVKIEMLGVQQTTLDSFGAVSSETAMEMSKGAQLFFGSDISVAVTGIAGPGGEVEGKPAGTVHISVRYGSELEIHEKLILRNYPRVTFKDTVSERVGEMVLMALSHIG